MKAITHSIAAGILGLSVFIISPVGQQLVKSIDTTYPKATPTVGLIVTTIGLLAALYHNPKQSN